MLLALALACAPRGPAVAPAPPAPSAVVSETAAASEAAVAAPAGAAAAGSPAAPPAAARPAFPEGWRGATVPTIGVTDADPSIGPADARFTIVSFADYFCPHCAAFWPQVRALVERSPDTRLVLKNWPIDSSCNPAVSTERHRFACLAARAAECAAKEGRSLDMADVLYLYPDHVTPPEMPLFAEKLEMDRPRFEACLADPATAAAVAADVQAGIDAGVYGTPAIYVSGLDPAGWVDVAPSVEILEAALAEARAGRPLPP